MKKKDAVRAGTKTAGYCQSLTRKRLGSLWLAVLLVFLGAACSIYGGMELMADKTGWGYEEYAKLIIGLLAGVFLFVCGVMTAYTALRDAFFPEKSTLARSIRSQLPYPEAAPGVGELFAMVDKDIANNGRWFDRVAVGKEWVLGDQASYIPRIRVFFGRDEIRSHSSGERVNTTRIVELYILDDRRQCQVTTLRNPRELQPLLDCISLRAPNALRRPYSEYAAWRQKPDAEWENMLRQYRVRQGEQEMEALAAQKKWAGQNMVLTGPDGSVTSRVTPALLRQTMLDCLRQGEGTFWLTPGCPVGQDGIRFAQLECFAAFYGELGEPADGELEESGEAQLLLKTVLPEAGETARPGWACRTDIRTAGRILEAWLYGELPDFQNWEPVRLYEKQKPGKGRELPPPHLGLLSCAGVFQSHDRFTVEDVEAAAQGIVDGSYQAVDVTLPGGYLWMRVQIGDQTDGRCRVSVTRADPDRLRYFRNRCTHRQAAAWLTAFAKGNFCPDWKQWKDYTRQVEKENKK